MLRIRQLGDSGVAMSGRLDASQADQADRELQRLTGPVALDLSELEYISSAGIAVLVKARVRLQEAGATMRVVSAHPRVRAVLHFAGLEAFFGLE